jgi:hypothetical protein
MIGVRILRYHAIFGITRRDNNQDVICEREIIQILKLQSLFSLFYLGEN